MPDGMTEYDAIGHNSMRMQVKALRLNETYSRSERVDFDTCTRDNLRDLLEHLRNTISPAVARARKDTGHEYSVEGGEWRTRNRDMVVTMIVTRIA